MHSKKADFAIIANTIQTYFEGLHFGNTSKLAEIFHPDACLQAPNNHRSLSTWLSDVANRPTPASLGNDKCYQILAIDIVGEQAMVKVSCPLFTFHYIDFLGLLKENDQWHIVSKMYADIGASATAATTTTT
ncbi:nuclear transport factor 2 family protein [Thalassotalea fusca]